MLHDQQHSSVAAGEPANEFRVQHVYEIGAGDWEGTSSPCSRTAQA
ncbi:MAG: hypothetical protein R3E96_03530 [Planctomycetota bacterium]